jgi:hypothetical protein
MIDLFVECLGLLRHEKMTVMRKMPLFLGENIWCGFSVLKGHISPCNNEYWLQLENIMAH